MKVILAVDGSKSGRWATQWLGELPFATPPEVRAVHVVDLAALRTPFVMQPAIGAYEALLQAEAKRLLARAKRVHADTETVLAAFKLKATVTVEKGPVALTIIKRAGGHGGLVVLGNRGLGDFDRVFLGSVSMQVTQHAPCSVLVIKRPPRSIRRILLAVDGSRASNLAMQFLLRQWRPAKKRGVEVTVLYVLPRSFAHAEVAVTGIKLAHRYADKLEDVGYRVNEAYRLGDPAEEIVRAAKGLKADLVVAGAKGLNAVSRFLLGSVSTKLARHCPCSILIVR
jgi:nucleotide-binding universal stress UspA family protein